MPITNIPPNSKKNAVFLVFLLSISLSLPVSGQDSLATSSDWGSPSVSIITEGEYISSQVSNSVGQGIWEISPDLPEGFRLFSRESIVDGRMIDSNGDLFCRISSLADILCVVMNEWGIPTESHLSMDLSDFSNSTILSFVPNSIAVGSNHICAIFGNSSDNEIFCWGSNSHGQSGGFTNPTNILSKIEKPHREGKWTQVSAGSIHSCAVFNHSRTYCWGANSLSQMGNGILSGYFLPIEVQGLDSQRIVNLESGNFHSCVSTENSEVFCWGWNGWGQLGIGGFSNAGMASIVDLPLDYDVDSMHLSSRNSCVISNSGRNLCWGFLGEEIHPSEDPESVISSTPILISEEPGFPLFGEKGCYLLISSNSCSFEKEYDFLNSANSVLQFTTGSGFSCFIFLSGEVSCIVESFGEEEIRVLEDLIQGITPFAVFPGLLLGFPEENFESDFEVNVVADGFSYSENFSISVDFLKDLDSDGWENSVETRCGYDSLDENSTPKDNDLDGLCDTIDPDDDNDGIPDYSDDFPTDDSEWEDKDKDGIGSNSELLEITEPIIGTIITSSILLILLCLEMMRVAPVSKLLRSFLQTSSRIISRGDSK